MATVAVDFDGVIHAYSRGWEKGVIYDEPVEGAFESLRLLLDKYTVFVHTSRNTQQVAEWLIERGDFNVEWEEPGNTGVQFWGKPKIIFVTNRKLPAIAYIDDRGIRFNNWKQALTELENV